MKNSLWQVTVAVNPIAKNGYGELVFLAGGKSAIEAILTVKADCKKRKEDVIAAVAKPYKGGVFLMAVGRA